MSQRAKPIRVPEAPADEAAHIGLYIYGVQMQTPTHIASFFGHFPHYGNETTALAEAKEIAAETGEIEGIPMDGRTTETQVLEIPAAFIREFVGMLDIAEGKQEA